MDQRRTIVLVGIIIVAAAFRLLPHPPNVTPIGALALFGGTVFADKRAAFLVPLTALFVRDLGLAAIPFFHNTVSGDALYVSLLFGGLALVERGWPLVHEPEPGSAR